MFCVNYIAQNLGTGNLGIITDFLCSKLDFMKNCYKHQLLNFELKICSIQLSFTIMKVSYRCFESFYFLVVALTSVFLVVAGVAFKVETAFCVFCTGFFVLVVLLFCTFLEVVAMLLLCRVLFTDFIVVWIHEIWKQILCFLFYYFLLFKRVFT